MEADEGIIYTAGRFLNIGIQREFLRYRTRFADHQMWNKEIISIQLINIEETIME